MSLYTAKISLPPLARGQGIGVLLVTDTGVLLVSDLGADLTTTGKG